MSGFVLSVVLVGGAAIGYYVYSKFTASTESEYESDGYDTIKVRHEGGI
jgi:hypothetical protein